jgi:hypothetical protein
VAGPVERCGAASGLGTAGVVARARDVVAGRGGFDARVEASGRERTAEVVTRGAAENGRPMPAVGITMGGPAAGATCRPALGGAGSGEPNVTQPITPQSAT